MEETHRCRSPGVSVLSRTTISRFGAALLLAAFTGGCGASSATSPIIGARKPATGAAQPVRFAMTIAGPAAAAPASKRRTPKFVSPSTAGILIQIYAHADAQHATLLGSSATDISSGSAACGGQTGFPRTCTVTAAVPLGDDDFVVTTYDAAPTAGAFATSANVLGRDGLEQTILAGVANVIPVFISGVIASVSSPQTYSSLPADGTVHSFGFVLQPQDFDNNPIVAGTNDPYANPITLTLAETGGSGHATLLLNGVPVGTTATVTHSSDTVALRYDGQGAPPYTTVTTVSAPNATPASIRVSPMYVENGDTQYPASDAVTNPPPTLVLPGAGINAFVDIIEANAPATLTYTATLSSGCNSVASVVAMSGPNALVSGGTMPAAVGTCAIAMSDGISTISVNISSQISGPINIPGGLTSTTFWPPDLNTLSDYTSATRGPDGVAWFWGDSASHLTRVAANGAITQFTAPAGQIGFGIATGSDGNLWVTDSHNNAIDRITTSGVWTAFPEAGGPVAIAAGSDGNLWFTESQVNRVGRITPSGTITEFPLPAGFSFSGNDPFSHTITGGPDGNVWFIAAPAIGRIAPDGTITMFPQANAPNQIAAGPDGNVWFTTETGVLPSAPSGTISKITPAGTVTAYQLPSLYPVAGALTAGSDGNLWVVVNVNLLAKVTVNGTVTEFAVPDLVQLAGITGTADGSLWIDSVSTFVRVQL
jgi:streptogramin lyase